MSHHILHHQQQQQQQQQQREQKEDQFENSKTIFENNSKTILEFGGGTSTIDHQSSYILDDTSNTSSSSSYETNKTNKIIIDDEVDIVGAIFNRIYKELQNRELYLKTSLIQYDIEKNLSISPNNSLDPKIGPKQFLWKESQLNRILLDIHSFGSVEDLLPYRVPSIYAFTKNSESQKSLLIWNSKSNSWTPYGPKYPDKNLFKSINSYCFHNYTVSMIGGTIYNEFIRYNLLTNQWYFATIPKPPRTNASIQFVKDNYIYIFGGYDENKELVPQIDRYKIDANRFEVNVSKMVKPKHSSFTCFDGHSKTIEIERFDMVENKSEIISKFSDVESGGCVLGAIYHDKWIYYIGTKTFKRFNVSSHQIDNLEFPNISSSINPNGSIMSF
eukprot:gene10768-13185_t